MASCSSTLKGLPLASHDTRSIHLFSLPQWHIFMCRARWMVAPDPSDEGAVPLNAECSRWTGAAKALFWMCVAVGTGLLLAGLSG